MNAVFPAGGTTRRGPFCITEGEHVNRQPGISFAIASPLFVPEICLYCTDRGTVQKNNCFSLQNTVLAPNYVPREILFAMQLMADYSMRASELLSIRLSDNVRGNVFLVRGKKRSRSYTIVIPGRWLCRPGRKDPRWQQFLFPFTYNSLYKWFCRTGVGGPRPGRKTNIRTHVNRYLMANAVLDIGDGDAASDALHHNSKRSLSYYTSKERLTHGKD